MRKFADSVLGWFGTWFASNLGVWQTAFVATVIVICEWTGLIHDQHGFWLLYWLTVYSAVTQPILAFVARKAGEAESAEREIDRKILTHVETLMEHLGAEPPPEQDCGG